MIRALSADGVASTRLGAADLLRVTELFGQCAGFLKLVSGDTNPATAARDLLEVGPPDVPAKRKHVLGFEVADQLIGVADLIQDYPGDGDWYVGLLLLLEQYRGRGVGRALWMELESWLHSSGGQAIRLVVQDQNPRAAAFWASLGFVQEGRVSQVLPDRTNVCWKFTKRL
jgi:ribosomal protein S18 acetylase RimI-like enzyme